MSPRSIAVLLVLLLFHCVACRGKSPVPAPTVNSTITTIATSAASPTTTMRRLSIRRQDGTQVTLAVEIAATPESQATGLSGRAALAPDTGELFVFPAAEPIEFWMHDTSIPLSIAFVAENRKIIDLQDMQPFSDTRHVPPGPIRYAIEANLGFFSRAGIMVGDDVDLDAILSSGAGNQ